MGFKRVRGKEINEIVLAGFVPAINKIQTFARIFINGLNAKIYKEAFKALFRLISNQLNKDIHWRHIHGDGVTAIVTDMDQAQLKGFGLYLESCDPETRAWDWHIMHINMFCHIHFYRSIGKAAGATGYSLVSVHSRMKELVRVTSREDYFLLCEALIESSDSTEAVQNWAVHKQQPVIASGLN